MTINRSVTYSITTVWGRIGEGRKQRYPEKQYSRVPLPPSEAVQCATLRLVAAMFILPQNLGIKSIYLLEVQMNLLKYGNYSPGRTTTAAAPPGCRRAGLEGRFRERFPDDTRSITADVPSMPLSNCCAAETLAEAG
jgi:hypothetical protein